MWWPKIDTMKPENNIAIFKGIVIPKFMGFHWYGEERSASGWIRYYRWIKQDLYSISEAELAKLEQFVHDNFDVMLQGLDENKNTLSAGYIIGSGDRIRIEDFAREISYGSRAGPSGEYFRKLGSEDYSEEEYFSLLCKEPYYLETLKDLQIGYDYLKARAS